MCSVKQNTLNFLAIANWMTSSRESFAWPGQNCPEWLWCENGIMAGGVNEPETDSDWFWACRINISSGNWDKERYRQAAYA